MKMRPLVEKIGEVSKRAWECVLLTAVRDEIRAGNILVQYSKLFGRFDDFFIADAKWVTDWQLLEEAWPQALAQVVNAISKLDVTQLVGIISFCMENMFSTEI